MFKSLGRKLNERAVRVDRTQTILRHTGALLQYYRVVATAQYDDRNDCLTIEAQTKTGASELTLHLTDMIELLKHTGYGVRRVVIR
jgi:hypothetical protein